MQFTFKRFVRHFLVTISSLLATAAPAWCQAVFTYVGGVRSWQSASSWAKSGDATTADYPGQAGGGSQVHNVVIGSGVVTLGINITSRVNNIDLSGGALSLAAGNTLAATGDVSSSAGASITIGSNANFNGGGNITVPTLTFAGAGQVQVARDFDVTNLVTNLVTGGSEVLFDGAGTQTIRNGNTFQRLALANTGGAVVVSATINASQTSIPTGSELRLATFHNSNLGTVTGSGILSLTGVNGGNVQWPSGNFAAFLNTSTVVYYGNASYNITEVPADTFANILFTGIGRRRLSVPATSKGSITIDAQDTLLLNGVALELAGGNLTCNGMLDGGTSTTVRFTNPSADQTLAGTGTYRFSDLTLDKDGRNLLLQTPIRIDGNLNLNAAGYLVQGAFDITLGPDSRVRGNYPFGNDCMIQQDGLSGPGALIKEALSAGQFVACGLPSPLEFIYPIGTGNIYAAAQINALSATVAGTATIAIKTIPFTSATANILRRNWRVQTANISSITDAQLEFSFDGSEVNGTPNLVIRTQGGTVFTATSGYVSGLVGRQTFGVNAAGNTFLEDIWSLARAGQLPRTYYSFTSGSWDTPATWTTDPTGSAQINMPPAGGPNTNDNVVVLRGHTVTMPSGSKSVNSVTLQEGATLDAGSLTTLSFGVVSGMGTLRRTALSLPTGLYDNFVSADGGTVEYANVTGNLPLTQLTYNNLTLSGTGTKTFATQGQARVWRLNGNLSVAAGNVVIGSESNRRVWISVLRNVTIAASASLTTSTNNANHNMDVWGDLVNNGTCNFTNRTPPLVASYLGTTPNNGFVRLRFLGASNNVVTCNAATNFHSIEVQKGIDPTFALQISTADSAFFNLLGNSNQADSGSVNDINTRQYRALSIRYGTVILGERISIPALVNPAGQWRINAGAAIVIDGARVWMSQFSNSNPMAVLGYGNFEIRRGFFDAGTAEGFVTRGAGEYRQYGGYFRTSRFRPSIFFSTTPRGIFEMTGGQMDLLGSTNSPRPEYGTFAWPFTTNVFKWSGGAINVYATNAGSTGGGNNSIMIGCDPANIEVTGGTLNVVVPSDPLTSTNNFGITSTAPFYNVNLISNQADTNGVSVRLIPLTYSSNTTVTLPARALIVLNDLNVGPRVWLNCASTAGVIVGGNATFAANSRFTPGSNVFVMGGTTPSRVAQSLALNKPVAFGGFAINNLNAGGTVTLSGSSPTVNGAFSLNAGTLNDGGLTITCAGTTINNSATHLGSGRIRIWATGTITQNMGGSGLGTYTNLDFAGSATSRVALLANQTVNGICNLTNGLVDLTTFNLRLARTASLVIGPGGHTATRTFTSAGLATDGGITREFSSVTPPFTAPLAFGGQLRPVTFSASAAVYGSCNIVQVNARHPFITIPPATVDSALRFHWKLATSGWTGVTSASLTAAYANADIPPSGNANDDNRYVVGHFAPGAYAWATSPYTTQSTNTFTVNSTSPDGDYTVGRLSAFGSVVVYETRQTGLWTATNTWKRTQGGVDLQNPSTTIPTANAPVIIRPGHTVTFPAAATPITLGSLRIDSTAVLDIGTNHTSTNIHNYGQVMPGLPSSGTFRVSSSTATPSFPRGNFTSFLSANTGGTVEYYRTSLDFTIPASNQDGLPLANYRNLNVVPTSGIVTLPARILTISGNLNVLGGSGTVRFASAATGDITVGADLTNTAGTTLQFQSSGTARFITVAGSLRNTGTFNAQVGGSLLHFISIQRDIVNNGVLDTEPGSSTQTRLQVEMAGPTDAVVSGSGSTTRFHTLMINKGTTQTPLVDLTATNLSLAGNGALAAGLKPLVLLNGTCRLSVNRNLVVSSGSSAEHFRIPSTTRLWVANGKVLVTATGANAGLQLDGTLKLSNTGVVRIDAGTTGTNDNSIQYASAGSPLLDMGGDSLNVGGQIRGNAVSASGSLVYNQTGGTVNIGYRNAATSIKGMLEVVNQGVFQMSDGNINIARSQANSGIADLLLLPASSAVTGGTIALGMGAYTPNNTTFSINATAPVWNLRLNTGSGSLNHARASLYTNPLTVLGACTFNTGTVFTCNNLDLRLGGDWVNNGTYNPGLNTTRFVGTGNQTLSGTSSPVFNSVEVNNSTPSGTITLAGTNWAINRDLTLANGTLNANARNISVLGNVANSATHTSTSGALILNGPLTQIISGSGQGAFGSLTIDNALAVQAAAGFTVNGTLSLVNGLLDIQSQPLTMGPASSVAGTFSASRMIRTAGNAADGGIIRQAPATPFSFMLPIGVDNLYTPVSYNATANTAVGTIAIKPVSNVHPLAVSSGVQALNYYWAITSTGLAGLNLTQVYTYDQTSATGRGNENLYVGARLLPSLAWQTFTGVVNNGANTITFSNQSVVGGDYTAGEAGMFATVVPFVSNGTGGWDNPGTWNLGSVPSPGSAVEIRPGHTVTATVSGASLARILINGTLNLGTTTGHNLGLITGTGTLRLATAVLPAGSFNTFTAAGGGTIQFDGAGHTLPASRTVYNNLVINSTGTISNLDAVLTLNGNFTVAAGTFNNSTNRKIIVRGNFLNLGTYIAGTAASNENLELFNNLTNNGTFIPGNTNVLLRGFLTQTIGGTSPVTFSRLQINKSSGAAVLGVNITATDLLTLDRGLLRLNWFNFTLGANCQVKPDVVTAQSYIWADNTGYLVRQIEAAPMPASPNITILPVGTATRFLPFNFRLKQATLAPGAQVALRVVNAAHPQRREASRYLNTYWQLEPTGITGSINYDVRYNHNATADLVRVRNDDPRPIRPFKYSSTAWTAGGAYDSTQRNFNWTDVTSFSDFTGGTGMGDLHISLPVTLTDLKASAIPGKAVELAWATESEQDNAGFYLERSADGRSFARLAWIPAHGSGTSIRRQGYAYQDLSPMPGRNLYRLAQISRNGKRQFSNVALADWAVNNAQPALTAAINPNPGRADQVQLHLESAQPTEVSLQVMDARGLLVHRAAAFINGHQSFGLAPAPGLPAGVYQVRISANGRQVMRRFVVE